MTYFTKQNNIQVHSCYCKWQNFILFHGWVVFHCVYMYHIFFIHTSVDGHWGCFHVLGVVNSAAMNIGVHVSFQIRAKETPSLIWRGRHATPPLSDWPPDVCRPHVAWVQSTSSTYSRDLSATLYFHRKGYYEDFPSKSSPIFQIIKFK